MQRSILMIFFIMLAAACKDPDTSVDVPALLTNPGPASQQEIERTLSSALNGISITLSAEVFTNNSVVVIQRNQQRSIHRPPELGRDLGRPYTFQLVTNGTQCALIDLQTRQRWPLTGVECVVEQK